MYVDELLEVRVLCVLCELDERASSVLEDVFSANVLEVLDELVDQLELAVDQLLPVDEVVLSELLELELLLLVLLDEVVYRRYVLDVLLDCELLLLRLELLELDEDHSLYVLELSVRELVLLRALVECELLELLLLVV